MSPGSLNTASIDEKDVPQKVGGSQTGKTGLVVAERDADVTLRLIEAHGDGFPPLSPEKVKKLQWKLYWRIMGLLSLINIMLFVDKSTLGFSAILGLFTETKITKAEYNNLQTFFYVGYILAQWPGHYTMQRLPLGKFVAGLVSCWGVIILLHCVATRYAGLVVLRIALGAAESVVVPAMEMTISMFFDRHQQSVLQPVLWITAAAAPILASFIAYGLLWAESSILPWKLLMIVTGGMSTVLAVLVWFQYPDNPATVKFLTLEEKIHTIRKVHTSSQSSIEQKHFKKEQFVETLRDPVSWLFALQTFCLMISNNLTYGQKNLFVTSLGIDALGSTLVTAAGGAFSVLMHVIAAYALHKKPSNLAYHAAFWCIIPFAGGIGMVTIAWGKDLALLACLILCGSTGGITYIIALGWTSSSAAGYTKKLTRNVMFMVGYSVSNLISPQIWVPSDAPRYYGAWATMIVVSWFGTPVVLLAIRYILARRNTERQEWLAGLSAKERDEAFGEVEQVDEVTGQVVKRKVDLALLDKTDLENKRFIYPL